MYNKQAFESGKTGGCGPWGRGKWGGFNRHQMGGYYRPPVNITETDTEYVIALFAAGLVKEKVKLTVSNEVLTLSYAAVDSDAKAETGRITHQEFSPRSFERLFQLNNKVLTDGISATYIDGILQVRLPKNPATTVPAQTIMVE